MKIRIFILVLISIIFVSGINEKEDEFTLKGFEKTLSLIEDNLFMSKYEVTNLQYRTFLNELKISGDNQKYAIAKIDTFRWIDSTGIYKPFASIYHNHPEYNYYPVVNISYEGAVMFCEWLTAKYNSYDKRSFKKVNIRLPKQSEWEKAARGGLHGVVYPWGGNFLVNDKCQAFCNYNPVGEEEIHYNRAKKKYEVMEKNFEEFENRNTLPGILETVNSYQGNGFDIYNLSGNAAEMVADKGIVRGGSWLSPGYDVRIESVDNYTHPDIYIGFRYCLEVVESF